MGILRVFLALIVVLGHCPPSYFLLPIYSGPLAVEAFYIISGFYIQLILQKYSQQSHWVQSFYLSRAVRIFSTYYFVLIATIAFRCLIGNYPLTILFEHGGIAAICYGIFMNLFLIGQDIARMVSLDLDSGGLHLTPSGTFASNAVPFGGFGILGQAWTLAPEIMFYLIAPFLLRLKSGWICLIASLSLYSKCYMEVSGVNWTTTFFPCELGYFLLGTLGCRVYESIIKRRDENFLFVILAASASLAILYLAIVWFKIPYRFHNGFVLDDRLKRMTFTLTVACGLPFIFKLSRNSGIDRAIGELSYPVYLIHLLLIELMYHIAVPNGYISLIVVSLSILLSIPIARYIEEPISIFRHKRYLKTDRLYPVYDRPQPPLV